MGDLQDLSDSLDRAINKTVGDEIDLARSTIGEVGITGPKGDSYLLFSELGEVSLVGGNESFIHIDPKLDSLTIGGKDITIEGETVDIEGAFQVGGSTLNFLFLPLGDTIPAPFYPTTVPFLTPVVITDLSGSPPHIHTIAMLRPQPLFTPSFYSVISSYISSFMKRLGGI